jgi:uncharacterized protein YecT (DUF1311 family)
MKKIILSILLGVCFNQSASAEDINVGKSIQYCEQISIDSPELTICLTSALKQADTQLNQIAQTTQKQLGELEKLSSSAKGAKRTFQEATSAFQNYREKACAHIYKSYASGSGAGQAQLECKIKLTQEFSELIK